MKRWLVLLLLSSQVIAESSSMSFSIPSISSVSGSDSIRAGDLDCKNAIGGSTNFEIGMTGVINKFQRILGLKVSENLKEHTSIPDEIKPIVFVSHMEHHSNQTSWLETIADVVVVPCNSEGTICLHTFEEYIKNNADRKIKIVSITSCSNVTGIKTPYHDLAKIIHRYNGLCFVDFACSAPYININMHPENEEEHLDAIYFSPHKFLGGPGSSGVLIFNESLYHNQIPDKPGGGTVDWNKTWGKHAFVSNIEARENGGNPGVLQTIRTALAIQLKEQMTVEKMLAREEELLEKVWDKLLNLPNLHVLAENQKKRLGVISFYIDDLHYNVAVKILNDRFGIQTRGGCSCAGTYGHYLLNVSEEYSGAVTCEIDSGNLSQKPGWIRMSIHPTMKDEELDVVLNAIVALSKKHQEWVKDYQYDLKTNEFTYRFDNELDIHQMVKGWFLK